MGKKQITNGQFEERNWSGELDPDHHLKDEYWYRQANPHCVHVKCAKEIERLEAEQAAKKKADRQKLHDDSLARLKSQPASKLLNPKFRRTRINWTDHGLNSLLDPEVAAIYRPETEKRLHAYELLMARAGFDPSHITYGDVLTGKSPNAELDFACQQESARASVNNRYRRVAIEKRALQVQREFLALSHEEQKFYLEVLTSDPDDEMRKLFKLAEALPDGGFGSRGLAPVNTPALTSWEPRGDNS